MVWNQRIAETTKGARARNFLRCDALLHADEIPQSETAQGYYRDVARHRPEDGRGNAHDGDMDARVGGIWKRFIRMAYGQKGPFSSVGAQRIPDEIAKKCRRLWPAGPPGEWSTWHCAHGENPIEYVEALYQVFRKTAPLPVASRWYELSHYRRIWTI